MRTNLPDTKENQYTCYDVNERIGDTVAPVELMHEYGLTPRRKSFVVPEIRCLC